MALAGRHFEDVSRARADTDVVDGVPWRLVMSAEDMPRYGMHEPAVKRAPTWIRAVTMAGGCVICWALVGVIWYLAH